MEIAAPNVTANAVSAFLLMVRAGLLTLGEFMNLLIEVRSDERAGILAVAAVERPSDLRTIGACQAERSEAEATGCGGYAQAVIIVSQGIRRSRK